jgi:hypothetical protein
VSVHGYRYGRVPEALLYSDASDRACRLHALLTRWADTRPGENPTRDELAGLLRCSVDSVDRASKELVAAGFLRIVPQFSEDGRTQIANDYLLEGGRSGAAPVTSENAKTAGEGGRTGAAGGGRTGAAAIEERDRSKREQKKEERSRAISAVFEAWKADTGRNGNTSLTDEKRKKINARLNEGFTVDQLVTVVTRGWRADPWPERPNENDLVQLLTTASKVEKFLRLAEKGRRPSQQDERAWQLELTRIKAERREAELRALRDGSRRSA